MSKQHNVLTGYTVYKQYLVKKFSMVSKWSGNKRWVEEGNFSTFETARIAIIHLGGQCKMVPHYKRGV